MKKSKLKKYRVFQKKLKKNGGMPHPILNFLSVITLL